MEFKPKNRDWVKNASIIFLSLLLVLTFFSNTWMNRSLPEVATQYVTNGTITAKVRGSGTVSAVGVTSVKADQTREIRAVMVKVGQEVKAGDVLFVLGQGEASELELAQEQLRQLQVSYQKAAVGISSPDYSLEERRIADARQAVEDARIALEKAGEADAKASGYDKLPLSQRQAANDEVTAASAALQKARDDLAAEKVVYDTYKKAYDDLMAQTREAVDARNQISGDNAAQKAAEYAAAAQTAEEKAAAKEAASLAKTEAESRYSALYLEREQLCAELQENPLDRDGQLRKLAELQEQLDEMTETWERQISEGGPAEGEEEITREMLDELQALVDKYERLKEVQQDLELAQTDRELAAAALELAESEAEAAESSASQAKEASNAAQAEAEKTAQEGQAAIDAVSDEQVKIQEAKVKELEETAAEAEETLRVATEKRDAIQATIDEILGQSGVSSAYKAAKDEYKAAKDTLFELEYNLQQKKISDSKSQSLDYLNLSDIGAQIEQAKKKVQELSGGEENQILAKTAGTIETIDCAPGDTKLKGDLLCTIEVPDLGYTMSFSVTNDQARRLKPGDSATVSNYYWGNQIVATLESIKADPKNPQTNKLLTFDVKGDVTAGTELTISVGQKSANYDIIVPNSAIRSDTNGSFVLAIELKSSPLGNRYIARRVEVKVLAEDDMNSAVTADLGFGDYVITTSNAPVKNGDMVRLADNT